MIHTEFQSNIKNKLLADEIATLRSDDGCRNDDANLMLSTLSIAVWKLNLIHNLLSVRIHLVD